MPINDFFNVGTSTEEEKKKKQTGATQTRVQDFFSMPETPAAATETKTAKQAQVIDFAGEKDSFGNTRTTISQKPEDSRKEDTFLSRVGRVVLPHFLEKELGIAEEQRQPSSAPISTADRVKISYNAGTAKIAAENPEKVDPMEYFKRGVSFGNDFEDPKAMFESLKTGNDTSFTIDELPEPVTVKQKVAEAVGNITSMSIAQPLIAEAAVSLFSKIPAAAKLLEAVKLKSMTNPWTVGFGSEILKSAATGGIFGLITKNKKSVAENVLETAGMFAGFSALAYPVQMFFRPIIQSVGKMEGTNKNLSRTLNDPAVTTEPISKTLYFKTPNNNGDFIKVTANGLRFVPKGQVGAAEVAAQGNSIPTITKLDIEAFKSKPSLYNQLKEWVSGRTPKMREAKFTVEDSVPKSADDAFAAGEAPKTDVSSADLRKEVVKATKGMEATKDPAAIEAFQSKLGGLQGTLAQFHEANGTAAVQITGDDGKRVGSIKTVEYSDGKFGVKVEADTQSQGMTVDYTQNTIYPTEAKAVEAGKKQLAAWAEDTLKNISEDAPDYEDIVKISEVARKETPIEEAPKAKETVVYSKTYENLPEAEQVKVVDEYSKKYMPDYVAANKSGSSASGAVAHSEVIGKIMKDGYSYSDARDIALEISYKNVEEFNMKPEKAPAKPAAKPNKRIGLMDSHPMYTPNMNRLIKEAQDNGDMFPFSKMSKEEQGILDKAWKDSLKSIAPKEAAKAPADEPAKPAPKAKKDGAKIELKPSKAKTLDESQKEKIKVGFDEKTVKAGNLKTVPRPTVGKTEVKTLLSSNKEFAANPTFIVDADKNLVFKGPKTSISIKASALGLNEANLKEGDIVTVDPKDLKEKGAEQQLRGYKGGSTYADVGVFRDGTPVKLGSMEKIRPIEMPELVRLARELTGAAPKVKEKMGKRLGYFRPDGKGDIVLRADQFKRGNEEQLSKLLAHELGHLVDWLPDKTMKRGNLLGRIYSLRNFLSSVFDKTTGEAVDLSALRNQAMKEVLEQKGVKYGDYISKAEVRDGVKDEISARYTDLVEAKKGIKNAEVKKELVALSEYWRPYDKSKSDKNYIAYRNNPKELYADAISVLFNSAGLLEEMAPTFYKEFFAALDEKRDVKAAFFELQELLNGSTEAIFKARKEDIRKGFARAEDIQKGFAAKKKLGDGHFWEKLRQMVDDVNYPILKKQKEAETNGAVLPDSENPKFVLQEQAMSDNENFLLVDDIDRNIVKPLEKANMTIDDFGEYLLLDRIQKDRADIANPFGFNPKNAAEQMAHLKAQIGDEGFALLKEKVQYFHDLVFKSVEEAVKTGAYNKEVFETRIKPNKDSYASFQVVDYMQDYVPATIKGQTGTLKEVANPFVSTILKTVALNRLNTYQRAKNTTISLLKENFPDEIKETKRITSDGKLSIFKPARDKGVIEVMEDGKMQSYDVDPYIADSFKKNTAGELELVANALSLFNNKLFKPVVTTFNLGFSVFMNPQRDFRRNYKVIGAQLDAMRKKDPSIKKLTVGSLLKAYAQAFPSAVKFAKGELNDFTRSLVESKAMNVPITDFNYDARQDELGRILERYGLVNIKEKKDEAKAIQVARTLLTGSVGRALQGMQFAANTFESVSKIAGAKIRIAAGEGGKQLAYNMRNFTGTPNFKTRGGATYITNEVFVFSNIQKEGLKADLKIAFDPETRSGYWYRTVKADILPKLFMFLASAGLAGSVLKRFYDDVSEYDKTNYIIIPLGWYTTDANSFGVIGRGTGIDGEKAVYMRIPHDEIGRLFSSVFWKIANATKDGKVEGLQDIAAIGAGQLPSVSPAISMPAVWAQYLSGKNPYDSFRGRAIIDDTTWKAGGGATLQKMVEWTTNNLGFTKFATYDKSKNTGVETFMQVAPLFSSAVKISDYGQTEQLKKVSNEQAAKEARQTLEDRDLITKYIKKAREEKTTLFAATKYRKDLIVDALGHTPKTKEETDYADRLMTKFSRALKRGLNDDPRVDAIITSTSNEQKRAILREIQKDMTDEEFAKFRTGLLQDKIVTQAVFFNLKSSK